jgi:hypothetical protein
VSHNKRFGPTTLTIFVFFGNYVLYNKNNLHQKKFKEDLLLLIAKELVSLSFVEAPFFRN